MDGSTENKQNLHASLIIEAVMEEKLPEVSSISTPDHLNLCHPLAVEFPQFARSADFGLSTPSVAATTLHRLFGIAKKWRRRQGYQSGNSVLETRMTEGLNGCQK